MVFYERCSILGCVSVRLANFIVLLIAHNLEDR